jgi:hypothetical protein
MNRKQRIERRKLLMKPFGNQNNKPIPIIEYNVKIEMVNKLEIKDADFELSSSSPRQESVETIGVIGFIGTIEPIGFTEKSASPKKSLLMPSLKTKAPVVEATTTESISSIKETPKHVVRISNINECDEKCQVIDFIFRTSDFGFTFLHVSESCKFAFVGLFSAEDAVELRDKFNGLAFNNMICVADLIVT